uniref:Class II fructose-1,6-bisphosphate aldolase n=1 Tax=candidate division WOR-3 bacterium TaxID=2052148 RepID=A0A7C4XDL7_UNCW3
MLVNLNSILPRAQKYHYAVGHFNTSNLEITQAIINAAEESNAPVILGVSEKAIDYAGLKEISWIVKSIGEKLKIPVVLHLDHGASFEIVCECIKHGFTSVMIDASHLPYKENLKLTKKVVDYAHKKNVSVEAEIGRLAGIEDNLSSNEAIYTDPQEAKRFAEEARCDALAIAIGTSHGAYKFKGKPRLRIDILQEIAEEVKIPLVLHGASGVKRKWVNYANRFGAEIEHTCGIPDHLIKAAIKGGICKINVDTDLRIAFTAGIRMYLAKKRSDFDPRRILGAGRKMVKEVVKEKIKLFGSEEKAPV